LYYKVFTNINILLKLSNKLLFYILNIYIYNIIIQNNIKINKMNIENIIEKTEILIAVIISLFIWFIIWRIIRYKEIKNHRKDASKRSRNVILWEVYEKVSPFLPGFPYNPKDMTFVWKWIDYIVFDWLSRWKLENIVFLEIKSWKSNLNKNEKMIKQKVENKSLKYEIFRI